MATATFNAQSTDTAKTGKGVFRRMFDGMIWLAERNPRLQQAQRLQGMSDADLAKRGLKREDIARHVFRDQYFL